MHLLCNDKGELVDVIITAGNVDDRKPLTNKHFINKLWGKLFGDKGYISKTVFSQLRKRAIVETVIDQLKNI